MAEELEDSARPEAEKEGRQNSRQEAARSRGREPIEIETRGFGGGLLHNGDRSKHFSVQIRPVPSRRAGARFAVGHHYLEGGRRSLIHSQFYRGQPPDEHDDGENREGQPSLGGLAA